MGTKDLKEAIRAAKIVDGIAEALNNARKQFKDSEVLFDESEQTYQPEQENDLNTYGMD